LPYLPPWFFVSDPQAVRGFWLGGKLYDIAILKAWLLPVVMWSTFTMFMLLAMLCLTILLRKQWTENEKLTYPLTDLPLELVNETHAVFRNKLLWIGFSLAMLNNALQGLHVFYPIIPVLPIRELAIYTTDLPWRAAGYIPVYFYPFGIALGMLLPLDLLFSTWFFFWIWKLESVVTLTLGWDQSQGCPYKNQQAFGAYVGIACFALWYARNHLKSTCRNIFRSIQGANKTTELLSYRLSAVGLLVSLIIVFIFAHMLGMDWWLVFAVWIIYFILAISITRMRAEFGPPAHDLHMGGPDSILAKIFGFHFLGSRNLIALSLIFWFNRAYRSQPMPFILEGMKMSDKTAMQYRNVFWAVLFAAFVGIITTFWSSLHVCYGVGAGTSAFGMINVEQIFGSEPFFRLGAWINNRPAPSSGALWAVGIGFVFTWLLNTLRLYVTGLPLHPVGFAISNSWAMSMLWASMFVAWAIKFVLLRYGGFKFYRIALLFFMGILIGECVSGSLLTLIGMAIDQKIYAFWP